jgi:hypothetical protein
MYRTGTLISLFLLAIAPFADKAAADRGNEFFEKKIRPVLAEHCYACHSQAANKHKGGLYLDSRSGLRQGGDSGPALVPGKPDESLLIKAVRYTDGELRMPPKGKLPTAVVADLTKWVAMGAPDPRTKAAAGARNRNPQIEEGRKFWAFQPPLPQPLPEVKETSWPRGAIDRFILEKLESKGLQPAKDAHRATLLRRAYFALIGLPPTPEQIDAFLRDPSAEAFGRVVDALLASPHFGERWGRHWLDVARFAESTGGGRSLLLRDAWRYRDYVINAFNADKPYDRFIIEQIAGDLLPHATPQERYELLVATAFLLLGPTNYERQNKPILEMDVIDEQLDTMGKAFLGMTIGCARCHDHKFDPIPTADYYALAGILKSTKMLVHANVSRWLERPLPLPAEQELALQKHEAALADVKSKLELARAAEIKTGKTSAGPIAVATLPGIVIDDTQAKKIGSWKHSTYSGNFVGAGYLYDDRAMKGEKTLTFVPDIPRRGFYEVRLSYVPHSNRADNVPVRIFHADGDDTIRVNEKQTPPIASRFVSLGRYRFEKGNQWFVMVSTDGANGHVVADAVQFLPEETGDGKKVPAPVPLSTKKSPKPADSRALEVALKRLQAAGPQRPMAMAVGEGDKIEDCHVCIRGNFHNRGAKVPRGFLQVLAPADVKTVIPANESGRRQLADWLASPRNPLTARVMVNRIWHHLFGAGLVRTVDNFGSTGEPPSHPELLDYLALRLVEEGWSVKKLIREIMLSRTYQMSSMASAAGAKLDPENRLLGHMNRCRLDAESLRDAMLAVSGDLDPVMGGPGLGKSTVVERDFKFLGTRRSVYTPILRNKLLELFEVFDFADPNISMGRRNVSTVSTQALFLMNSPFVMDQAARAARSSLVLPGLDDSARVDRAYRQSLGRLPSAGERRLALAFLSAAGQNQEDAWERLFHTLFACIDFRYVD